MKLYSLAIEEKLVKEVDKLIKKYGIYSSRSDFIRDAIRTRLIEIKRLLEEEKEERTIEISEETLSKAMEEAIKSHEEKKYTGVH